MGSTASSPIEKEVVKDGLNLKDPLKSDLTRRRKRKSGMISDTSSNIVKKMKETKNNVVPDHIKLCIDYHQTKPWLSKPLKTTLIAYPQKGENPPEDMMVFFNKIPATYTSTLKERTELLQKGGGYKWFLPTPFFWNAHCFIQHQKNNSISCDVEDLVRTFTDKDGNSQSFIVGAVFKDETFKILDESDYRKECEWWSKKHLEIGGFSGKKSFLKNIDIDTEEGKKARKIMKLRISSVYSTLGKIKTETDPFILELESIFYDNIKTKGTKTIYDYVSTVLSILIFIKPESPIYKYTSSFRSRLSSGYYNIYSIASLQTFDMFPDLYTVSKSSEDIDKIKGWVKTYHDSEIDNFFNSLVNYINPTISRPIIPKNESIDLNISFKINNERLETELLKEDENKLKKLTINERDILKEKIREKLTIKEQCKDLSDNIPIENILLYKSPDGKVFCFTIDQLLNLEDDTNPLDPSGPKISGEFLIKFKTLFKSHLDNHSKKEDECTQCRVKIDEYILRTGGVKQSKNGLETYVKGFCSIQCLDKHHEMEELYGKDNSNEKIEEMKESFKNEKKGLEEKCGLDLMKLNEEEGKLKKLITEKEERIHRVEMNTINAKNEKRKIEEQLKEKQRMLEEQRDKLEELRQMIAIKAGRTDLSKLSNKEVAELLEVKDKKNDEKVLQYDVLSVQIKMSQDEVSKLRKDLLSNIETITNSKRLINDLTTNINQFNIEIGIKNKQIAEKNKELQQIIAESKSRIQSLNNEMTEVKNSFNRVKQENLNLIGFSAQKQQQLKQECDTRRDELINKLRTEHQEVIRSKDSNAMNLDQLLKERDTVNKQLQTELSKEQSLVKVLNTNKKDIEELTNKISNLEEKNKKYEADGYEQKWVENARKIKTLNETLKTLGDENKLLIADKNTCNLTGKNKEDDITRLDLQVTELQKLKVINENKIKQLEQSIGNTSLLKVENDELKIKVSELSKNSLNSVKQSQELSAIQTALKSTEQALEKENQNQKNLQSELERINNEGLALRNKMGIYEEKIKKYEKYGDIEKMEGKQKRLSELEEMFKNLKVEKKQNEESSKLCVDKSIAYQEQISRLEEAHKQETTNLQNQLALYSTQLNQLKEEHNASTQSKTIDTDTIKMLSSQQKQVIEKLQKELEKEKNITKSLDEKEKTIVLLNQKISKLEEKNKTYDEGEEEKIKENDKRINNLNLSKEQLQDEYNKLIKSSSTCSDKISATEKSIHSLTNVINEYKSLETQKDSKIKELQNQITELQKSKGGDEELYKKLEVYEQYGGLEKIQGDFQKLEKLKIDLNKITKDKIKCENQCSGKSSISEEELNSLQNQIKNLQQSEEEHKQEISTLNKRLETSGMIDKTLKDEIQKYNNLLKDKEKIEVILNNKEEERQKLEEKIKVLEEKIDVNVESEKKIDQFVKKIEEINKQLNKKDIEIQNKVNEIHKCELNLSENKETIDTLKSVKVAIEDKSPNIGKIDPSNFPPPPPPPPFPDLNNHNPTTPVTSPFFIQTPGVKQSTTGQHGFSPSNFPPYPLIPPVLDLKSLNKQIKDKFSKLTIDTNSDSPISPINPENLKNAKNGLRKLLPNSDSPISPPDSPINPKNLIDTKNGLKSVSSRPVSPISPISPPDSPIGNALFASLGHIRTAVSGKEDEEEWD